MGSSNADALVELADVHKSYGARGTISVALAGVSLSIAGASSVSLIGPSGSGKTTLLNVVAGLDVPDRGRVLVDGRDLARLTDGERSHLRLHGIGFVFQAFNLIPSLTVAENVTWPLEFSGVSRHGRQDDRRPHPQRDAAPSPSRRRLPPTGRGSAGC